MILEFEYNEASNSQRLDVFVSFKAELTRSNAQKIIEDGCVKVNNKQ